MKQPISLDDQIVAALTKPCSSGDAATVLADAQAALEILSTQADEADVASLDPLATGARAREIRQEASEHRFEADRMAARVVSLQKRIVELREAEERAATQARKDAAMKDRDSLAADIARDYPKVVATLTSLAKRIVENDAALAAVGVHDSAELIGRGLSGWTIQLTPVHRIQQIRLQMPASCWNAYEPAMSGWQWRGLDLSAGKLA